MTIKYECDRCHKQTTDPKEFMSVTTNAWNGPVLISAEKHYCEFCSLLMNNAQSIVEDGTYGGSLYADCKIGEYYMDHREKYDPLMMKEGKK